MYACMYVCVFDRRVSPLLRKEQQQHEYNKDKKKKRKKGQQIKLAIPNVQKNMSTSLEKILKKEIDRKRQRERARYKIELLYCFKKDRYEGWLLLLSSMWQSRSFVIKDTK